MNLETVDLLSDIRRVEIFKMNMNDFSFEFFADLMGFGQSSEGGKLED